ncbi:fungal-specific transcription factor domain-containing protein [Thelonectria olida]|uniref:Fungal-specific transcription factor domain-containing protein n=1 Tax=Thelonectria olida TaxID=1576542 RepID=A0A9P9ANM5_9HYPO|nr:fungal-specific transcription factor domain-containing protein [Thelonectria olida]
MVQKRACDACHRRKIQCDSTDPETPCNWCDHHGLACTFDRVRGRKKRAKSKNKLSVEQSFSDRLGRIEDALARTIARQEQETNNASSASSTPTPSAPPTVSTPSVTLSAPASNPVSLGEQFAAHESIQSPFISTPSSTFSAGASFGQIHYGGCHLGQISSHNGMPILSEDGQRWISARTGEDVSFSRFHLSFQQRALPPTLSPEHFYSSTGELYTLPPRAVVEQVTEAFLRSSFRLVFPVIDRVLFEETVNFAYEECDGQPSLNRISAKGCVLAFVSIMCLFQNALDNVPPVDGDACAVKAHYLLSDVFEDASIVSLQTVFMLHMHQTFSGRLQSAAMLHAIACRIVFMLGGHTDKPIKTSGPGNSRKEREARQLRLLFWLCYVFDKDIALRTGQPPLMSGDYCDLTLPDKYMECYLYLPDLKEDLSARHTHEDLTPHLPGDLRLSYLKDKTCRLLYSVQAQKKSDAEILRNIRELDDELETWRLSIPPDFRPTLSITEKNQVMMKGMELPRSMRHIGLHLEYHHLMTTIHRASERCYTVQAENSTKEGDWNLGVRSSIALSLEASRSTLIYLRAAVTGLAGEAFWIIVFYPTAAIMTIFLNILKNPLEPQAKLDLDLLSSATDLVRSMPVRRLTLYEIGHIKMVNEFVAELIRLGNCAILKADIERRRQNETTA